ncbi:hypothetical protein Pcac1_g16929 [Phytophthora cactorum]|nr:hypothetical protein Pcac1_g16929 [Phytophthora cactorum]
MQLGSSMEAHRAASTLLAYDRHAGRPSRRYWSPMPCWPSPTRMLVEADPHAGCRFSGHLSLTALMLTVVVHNAAGL